MKVESTSGPSAKIVLDSVSEWGQRITTMEVKMHRFVLAEMNTHRAFSRNSASSRAIPVEKIIERVENDPAWPVYWGKEQKGMQSGEELGTVQMQTAKNQWDDARYYAVKRARFLVQEGLHKSLVNRLLEPFMWHTAIITATEWDNFFHQRCHPDAQPEMKCVADAMQIAYFSSVPNKLAYGEWHMPYITHTDYEDATNIASAERNPDPSPSQIAPKFEAVMEILIHTSVARCARVSYLTHDGKRDLIEDLKLFDRLEGSGHWSPFEHVACPISPSSIVDTGNFQGWKPYRKLYPDENRTGFLPNLPELAQTRMRLERGLSR